MNAPLLSGVFFFGGERMRPGGTQTKRGAAVRMRRRLGLAPRAYVLLSCSLVLVMAGVSAYGMTVPSMMQAHTAREPRVGHEVKSDLGTTTGYAWASVVAHIVFGTDDADGAEAPDNEVTLANGKTIVLTNTKIIDRLSNNSVAATVNKVEQQKEQDAQQSGSPVARILLAPARIRRVRAAALGRAPLPEGLEMAARRAATLTTMQTPVAFPLLRKRAFTVGL